MRLALESLTQAKELWVFGLKISKGMENEIRRAEELKMPIRNFTSDGYEM